MVVLFIVPFKDMSLINLILVKDLSRSGRDFVEVGRYTDVIMEKLKCGFPAFCKQTFPQLHKTASYAHYTQCRLLRNPSLHFI